MLMTRFSIHNEVKSYKPLSLLLSPFILPILNSSLSLIRENIALPEGINEKKVRISTTDDAFITLIIYTPDTIKRPAPALLYFYGSSYFLTRPPHIKRLTAEYALRTNAIVIDVAYRLSPQHPFPKPFYDALKASEWLMAQAKRLNINTNKLAIGGDSSGAALASNVTLFYRNLGFQPFFYQFLIYPVTDVRMRAHSLHDFPFWSVKLNKMMWSLYIRNDMTLPNEYASPMEAESFEGLPETYVEVCEYDPLRDEGLLFAEALRKANIQVESHCVRNAFHSFDLFATSDLTEAMMNVRVDALNRAFNK